MAGDLRSVLLFGNTGHEKFGDIARVLGREDRRMPGTVQKILKDEARRLKREAKASIMKQPNLRGVSHGLRKEIRSGIDFESIDKDGSTGFKVITQMPDEKAYIPRGFDTTWRGWRHPVFAKKGSPRYIDWNRWVTQHGAFPWWRVVMDTSLDSLEPQLQSAVESAAGQLVAEAEKSH